MPEAIHYSIVVVGNMNPAIHHPQWYVAIGALATEEATVAEQGRAGAMICLPALASFSTEKLVVQCDLNKWTVTTSGEGQDVVNQALFVACRTFEVLEHTPVNAYGLNINQHMSTTLPNTGRWLAESVRGPLGLAAIADDDDSASVRYSTPSEHGRVNARLEPSAHDPSSLYLGINLHCIAPAEPQFDLTPLLETGLESVKRVAGDWRNSVQNALHRSK